MERNKIKMTKETGLLIEPKSPLKFEEVKEILEILMHKCDDETSDLLEICLIEYFYTSTDERYIDIK